MGDLVDIEVVKALPAPGRPGPPALRGEALGSNQTHLRLDLTTFSRGNITLSKYLSSFW